MSVYDPITTIINLASKKPTDTQWYAALTSIINHTLEDHPPLTDSTTNDMSVGVAHGLMPKGDGNINHYYRSDGAQTAPPGTGGVGGATGVVNNAIIVADGPGGNTVKGSGTTITTLRTQYQYIPLTVRAWDVYTPLSMGGTGAELTTERLSNGIERTYLGYGYVSAQYAFCDIDMPDDWDGGALTMKASWETASATTNTCEFEVYGARVANGATSNVALSTKLFTITDTNTGAGYRNESAEVALASITGTGTHISLMLTRDYTNSTLSADVKFLGVMLKCIVVKA